MFRVMNSACLPNYHANRITFERVTVLKSWILGQISAFSAFEIFYLGSDKRYLVIIVRS